MASNSHQSKRVVLKMKTRIMIKKVLQSFVQVQSSHTQTHSPSKVENSADSMCTIILEVQHAKRKHSQQISLLLYITLLSNTQFARINTTS